MLCAVSSADAGEIAALVEEASGPFVTVQPMDLLEAGQVVDLSGGGRLVLGYLLTCTREIITGGRVTIGAQESTVEGGEHSIEDVDCDGGQAVRSNNDAQDVAGAVFRKGKARKPLPKPDWTVFGTQPIFRLSDDTRDVSIERIDEDDDPIVLQVRGGLADTALSGAELDPGGLYAVTTGHRVHVLKVSPLAEPQAPLLSRLVPL